MNNKKCKILGFSNYTDKDTQEEMLRIVIAIKPNSEKYYGISPVNVFLKKDDILVENLQYAIDSNLTNIEYETEENIATGKTRVIKLIFD